MNLKKMIPKMMMMTKHLYYYWSWKTVMRMRILSWKNLKPTDLNLMRKTVMMKKMMILTDYCWNWKILKRKILRMKILKMTTKS